MKKKHKHPKDVFDLDCKDCIKDEDKNIIEAAKKEMEELMNL